jgi:hypothetical protein
MGDVHCVRLRPNINSGQPTLATWPELEASQIAILQVITKFSANSGQNHPTHQLSAIVQMQDCFIDFDKEMECVALQNHSLLFLQ